MEWKTAGQIKDWYNWYLTTKGINHYAINSILFLTTVREKYVKMYENSLTNWNNMHKQ